MINLLGSIQCNVVPDDIQACHRLPSRNNLGKKTIVKFVNRKKSDLALGNRRMLKDVEKSFNDKFTGNEQLYINANLTPYFFMHFCPGTMTTHAESINSDLQRGLDRRLRHTQH